MFYDILDDRILHIGRYREFDAWNRVVYEKYYDTDGFAVMLEDGAVSHRYEYDDDGKLIKDTKYDYADHEVK